MNELRKPDMTPAQKRLLWLVYIMGGMLVVLFVAVISTILWQLVKH